MADCGGPAGAHASRRHQKPPLRPRALAKWLKFDNSYFTAVRDKADPELLVLATDAALYEDPAFAAHATKYAESQGAFFEDYAAAHVKLAELGVEWEGEPITL